MFRTVTYEYLKDGAVAITLCEETAGTRFSGNMMLFDANNVQQGVLLADNFSYSRIGTMLYGRYILNPTKYPSDARFVQLGEYRVDINVRGNKRGAI